MANRAASISTACAICLAGVAGWSSIDAPVEGEQAFQEHCVRCHRLTLPLERPKNCEQWKVTVARMAQRRVRLKQEPMAEETRIVLAEYLAERDTGR